MEHTPLIATIVGAIVLAFVFGAVAQRLKISPLVGYLLAGVAVGPFTPGFIADQALASELSEIGVILLMFGVGLHFSLKDLLSVRAIAIPGALTQIAVATILGLCLALALGWSVAAGLVFGLALSVASTVVLLRALQERRLVETDRGRIAVGWLIVEDLVMVLVLVLLPGLSGSGEAELDLRAIAITLSLALGKVALFIAIVLIAGRRLIPWVLHFVAHSGSRELFRLAVLALALGTAFGAASIFNVSFALGAFFAGLVLGESALSQQAARETLPLRDAFAVLFFVSVGMLVDPSILWRQPWLVLATLSIILIGKSLAAYAITRLFRQPLRTSLFISASLAQIGEFSFILAGLGVTLGVLPSEGRDLILAGAILSIMLNPLVFVLVDRWDNGREKVAPAAEPRADPTSQPIRRALIIGYGRVGGTIGSELLARAVNLTVVENDEARTRQLEAVGIRVVTGNAADSEVLMLARPADADWLFVAVPDSFEAGQVVEQARRANASLRIIARAHSDEEAAYLSRLGADLTVMGERALALAMVDAALASIAPPEGTTAVTQ